MFLVKIYNNTKNMTCSISQSATKTMIIYITLNLLIFKHNDYEKFKSKINHT